MSASELSFVPVPAGRVLTMAFNVSGAASVRLHLRDLSLSEGTRLHVYGTRFEADRYVVEGKGPWNDGEWWTPPIAGDRVVIECLVPDGAAEPEFRVVEISPVVERRKPVVQSDIVGCTRSVPSEWAHASGSTVELDYVDSYGIARQCTGTLLANGRNDQTPLVLTASACAPSVSSVRSMRVYWLGGAYSDGATLLGKTSGGALLLVEGAIKTTPVYAAWDAGTVQWGADAYVVHIPYGSGATATRSYASGDVAPTNVYSASLGAHVFNIDWDDWTNSDMGAASIGAGVWNDFWFADPKLFGFFFYDHQRQAQPTARPASSDIACNTTDNDYFVKFSETYAKYSAYLDGGGGDDGYEPNDTLATAREIPLGFSASNLIVKKYGASGALGADWYRVWVPAGSSIRAAVSFTHAWGDIDIAIYRSGLWVTGSAGASNSETVEVTNSGAAAWYTLQVRLFSDVRNSYSLSVTTPCSFSLTPSGTSASAAGGTYSVTVSRSSTACSWSAVSNASWLSVTMVSMGTTSGTVTFRALANTTTLSRTGTLTIAGKTYTVNQAGVTAACSFALSSSSFNASESGQSSYPVTVTTGSTCSWNAWSNVSWIQLLTAMPRVGTATLQFRVSANSSTTPRIGTLTIAGRTYTVSQSAQLLRNYGFESGASGAWLGDQNVITNHSYYPAYTGTWYGWFGGVGWASQQVLYQDVYIPAGTTAAYLNFMLRVHTNDTSASANDRFYVELRTTSGALLRTLMSYSNMNAGWWSVRNVNISSSAGSWVRVSFRSTTNGDGLFTSFLIDNVRLEVRK